MRAALTALTDELKRLRASGVRTVVVTEESLQRLRAVVSARTTSAPTSHVSDVVAAPAPLETPTLARLAPPAPAPSARPVAPRTVALEPTPAPTLPRPPLVSLPEGDKSTRWEALCRLVAQDPVCLQQLRPGKKPVVGVGSLEAKIFFCGDVPGEEEETAGEPFVGPAGQLLTKMIQGMGLKRADVYIASVMNWRPQPALGTTSPAPAAPRPASPEELAYCLPYLKAQLEIVAPQFVVILGASAAQALLGAGSFTTLGQIRGQWREFAGRPALVTYHPSYILRNPTNRSKRAIWEDLLKVMERSELPITDKQRAYFLDK